MSDLKCVYCVQEYVKKVEKAKEGGRKFLPGEYLIPAWENVGDADTLLPSWQSTTIGDQMIVGCVALPMCAQHIEINRTKETPQQIAARSGLAIPGM